jgi:phosphate ABC transporter permease protein PstC/phosphate ABC transporter permease subunit PstA
MEAGTLTSTPAGDRPNFGRSPLSRLPDQILRWGLRSLAALVFVIIAFFFYTLIDDASLALRRFGVFSFVFDSEWVPSKEQFGAWPLVAGTLITSAIALTIGVPVAVATALFTTELCPRRLRGPLTVMVELLAAVPSVVYGLWGVFVLIPRLLPAERWFSDNFAFLPFVGGTAQGPNYFIAGLILAIMIIPIVSAITREVMSTVPADHKEAALALGATRWEMICTAILPYSRAGIVGAAMLGLGRALGETIAATLVIGNAPVIGDSVFSQGYTLAAVIANEFGEAASDPLHRSALIAAGLVLFVLTLGVNGVARAAVVRSGRAGAEPGAVSRGARGLRAAMAWPFALVATTARRTLPERTVPEQPAGELPPIAPRRRWRDVSARGMLGFGTLLALVPLVLVVYYLVAKGAPAWGSEFFTTDPTGSFFGPAGGIRSAIVGTLLIVALAAAIAIPVGIGIALYLTEYGRAGWFASTVRYFVDVMTGVPSIVFGLFIYIVLIVGGGAGGFAGWKGSLALALLMLPVVARSAEVVLNLVPDSLREAALALGAPRWRVVTGVVLPTALPGLITGSLLAIARAAGETAPLLFTATIVKGMTLDLGAQMNSLPAQIFQDVQQAQPRLQERAWGAALALVAGILILTLSARLISRRSRIS